MNKWYVNEANSISALWYGSNPNLIVKYKSLASGGWIVIGEPTDIGDNLHTIQYTFPEVGEYLILIKDLNTLVSIVDKLKVELNHAEVVCGCVETSTTAMHNELQVLDEGLRQVLGQVTDQVQENQTIMEKTGFIVTI